MKIILFALFLAFANINLCSNENWIPIESINKTQKQNSRLDVNLSQIEPINKMMKNAMLIKQLIDSTGKKEKPTENDKNWFALDTMENK